MSYKVQIDTSKINNIPWTTSSNYRITIEEGFVREASGNRLVNPEITFENTVTSFSNNPIISVYHPSYNNFTRDPIVRLSTNRGAIYNSTVSGNFYLFKDGVVLSTITNTSTNVSYVNGYINLDLSNILTTSSNYHIQCDGNIAQDLFNFKTQSINDNSVIKFITSGSYISLLPEQTFTFYDVNVTSKDNMQTSINNDYFAISIIRDRGTSTTATHSVTVFSNTGNNALHTFENTGTNFDIFGQSISLDTKLVISSPITSSVLNGDLSGRLYIYNTGTWELYNTISYTSQSSGYSPPKADRQFGWFVIHKGNYILTCAEEVVILYNIDGSMLWNSATSSDKLSNNSEDLDAVVGSGISETINPQPLCLNSNLFGYLYESGGIKLRLYNLSNYSLNSVINLPGGNFSYCRIDIDNTYALFANSYTKIAYVYELSSGNLIYTLTIPDSFNFGCYVKITPNYFIVADSDAEYTSGNPHGRIYLFSRTTGQLIKGIDNPYTNDPQYQSESQDFGVTFTANSSTLIALSPWNYDSPGSYVGDTRPAFRYDITP